jgi:hypothetical protein
LVNDFAHREQPGDGRRVFGRRQSPPADKGVQDMSVDQSTDTSTQDTGTQDTGTQDMAADQSVTNPYNSVTAITNFLENKTIEMTGADIPTHPNGFDRNQNLGAASQCINKTSIAITSGLTFDTSTILGTLTGAPNVGDVGTCDINTAAGSPLSFKSTAVLIENVAADGSCFDITVTYDTFSQEGRATISADGKTVKMELFLATQASGHRCAAGAPGLTKVTVTPTGGSPTELALGQALQTFQVK